MDKPQQIDPCVFIRKDIEITQKLIDDDRVYLQHPEILTHDVIVRLKVDLQRRSVLLDSFKDSLHRCQTGHRCQADDPRCESPLVAAGGGQRTAVFTVSAENTAAGSRIG